MTARSRGTPRWGLRHVVHTGSVRIDVSERVFAASVGVLAALASALVVLLVAAALR